VQTVFGSRRPRFWAIHPGGRAIVDRLAEIFTLSPQDLLATREVLRQYGNMSSATILFVLEHLRRQLREPSAALNAGSLVRGEYARGGGRDSLTGVAMAFGPGLVVELSRLTYVPPLPPLAPAEHRVFGHVQTVKEMAGPRVEPGQAQGLRPGASA
jgi:hypothetical protein